jgi:hypothetical protein
MVACIWEFLTSYAPYLAGLFKRLPPGWAHLEESCWANLGQIWAKSGSISGPLWAHCRPMLGPSWAEYGSHIGPICAHIGTQCLLQPRVSRQASKRETVIYIYIYIYIYRERRFNHMSDGLYICSIRLDLSSARVAMISAGFRHSEHLRKVSPAAATARFGCPGPPHYCPRPL